MNTRRCLKIASRIGTLLEHHIGIGVDAGRMLTEHLYMRDVLLVCDAHRGSELAELAIWFRRSAAERPAEAPSASTVLGDTAFDPLASTFSASGYPVSGFDGAGDLVASDPASVTLIRERLDQERAAARHGGRLLASQAARR